MAKYTIGIDPGNTGGIALFLNNSLQAVFEMPNITVKTKTGKPHTRVSAAGVANILKPYAADAEVILEQVAATPQMGVSSAFAFGQAQGIIYGVLGALEIPVREVAPQAWKAAAGIKVQNAAAMTQAAARGLGKDLARAKVIRLFPAFEPEFRFKKNADKADAVLIAMWGLQNL